MKDLIESEFFIHKGTLFHTRTPEYERLFLNRFIFGFGMRKFLLDVDLKLRMFAANEKVFKLFF